MPRPRNKEDLLKAADENYKKLNQLIDSLNETEMSIQKAFPAVGGTVLGSYFVSSTSSHYDWAMKKIKAHQRNCKSRDKA